MSIRELSSLDNIIGHLDKTVQALFCPINHTRRTSPADPLPEPTLNEAENRLSAGLMRVNHAGEIAAQGLYQGQAMTAKLKNVREQMQQAAEEELDHLFWCQTRLIELNSHTSYAQPIWYLGAVCMGALAGLAGDKWSLGFVAETENQVSAHLASHSKQLPPTDQKSLAIIAKMREDEIGHANLANQAGAAPLPTPIRWIMKITAKIMTTTAYWF